MDLQCAARLCRLVQGFKTGFERHEDHRAPFASAKEYIGKFGENNGDRIQAHHSGYGAGLEAQG
jgi:hypothetical protein